MKRPEKQSLDLYTESLKFEYCEWFWHGAVLFWMADTEVSNVLLVGCLHINWFRWPPFRWDESFNFIEEVSDV